MLLVALQNICDAHVGQRWLEFPAPTTQQQQQQQQQQPTTASRKQKTRQA